MTCTACGYDPFTKVRARYTIVLKAAAVSQNSLKSNTRGDWKYRKIRNSYIQMLMGTGVPSAQGKRRVFLTRFWGHKKRAYDYGNLVGGMKPLLDALVHRTYLVDDKPRFCEDHYMQAKSPDNQDKIVIVLEDLDE